MYKDKADLELANLRKALNAKKNTGSSNNDPFSPSLRSQSNRQGTQSPYDNIGRSKTSLNDLRGSKKNLSNNPLAPELFDELLDSVTKSYEELTTSSKSNLNLNTRSGAKSPYDDIGRSTTSLRGGTKSPYDDIGRSAASLRSGAKSPYDELGIGRSKTSLNEDEKKPKRKLELYRMDPIYIPPEVDESCNLQQKALIEQFKDMQLECHYCKDHIDPADEKIMVGQNFYHLNHVQCNKCGAPLEPERILELGDDIYCENCFETECDLGKNLCGYCNEEIFGDLYIKALDKVWHPNHFFCSYCGCKFDENTPFFEINGKPYCEEDQKRLFGRMCKFCNEVINDDNFISAMDMCWHNDCFKCRVCNKYLGDEAFYYTDNDLYCEYHYQEKENLLCNYCKKPVDKRYVFALNKKWHPNHFFCNFCKNVLYTDTGFKEYNDKAYCKDCFIRLYG